MTGHTLLRSRMRMRTFLFFAGHVMGMSAALLGFHHESLHRLVFDAKSLLENHLAAEKSLVPEQAHAAEREQDEQKEEPLRHGATGRHSPGGQHSEHTEQNEPDDLMGPHDVVAPVGMLFERLPGHEAGDDGHDAESRAGDQNPAPSNEDRRVSR